MEGFKSNPKMQCFKEGGQVKYESRKEHKEEMSADLAQDKKIIKKAFKMHDEQEHKGEKTDLSKLRKGGRAKKDCGTVKKYKVGGSVENTYTDKKTDKDIKDIAATKRQKPQMLCGGKKVRKYEAGGSVLDTVKEQATDLKNKILGTPEQNRIAQESLDRQAASGSKLAKFFGGQGAISDSERAAAESAAAKQQRSNINRRAGGKVCK